MIQKSQTTRELENKLRANVSQKAGINVRAVNCPATTRIESGQLFNCQATAEGKTFTLSIRSPDDKRELQWNTTGLLVLPKLEQTIQQGIKEQFRLDVKTNCGGTIRIAKPGDTFECKVIDGRGQTKTVVVRVDDEKGNVTWKL
ncbi:MAG: DUF4333 domain-containing protein [Leptolyngbyaceae cyanobacterium RU_5_1]|nr:DUF4333 domain-containing protein [Leptolyngbyaceae cyanobacterium RU_5_1]